MTKRMQGRSVRGGLAAGLVVAAAAGTLFAAGCGDNSGNPTGYVPEGTTGAAILLTDVQPFDADTTQVYVQMLVFSPPPADGFRFYVNPNGEGYRPATGAPIPALTTFDSGWGYFQSALDNYDPTTTSVALLARGARGGIESTASPVTSTSLVMAAPARNLARRQVVVQTAPRDSAVVTTLNENTFTWAPLPGAGSYVLQAFSISSGEPSMVVYINDVTKQRVELEMSIQNLVPYLWQVVAFDPNGRAIGVSGLRQVQYIPGD